MQLKRILAIAAFATFSTLAKAQDKSSEKDILTIYKGAHSYKEVSVAGKTTEIDVDDRQVAGNEIPHYDSLIQVMRTDVDDAQGERDREQSQRDREQGQRDREQGQRDREQGQRDREQGQRDREQDQRDREQAKRDWAHYGISYANGCASGVNIHIGDGEDCCQ
ncbi:MAG TPA: hypothetical protein VGS79_18900 [Puia sp.]|nr:hypothetical protein [Puia sp.]